jgi:hypothetical protein
LWQAIGAYGCQVPENHRKSEGGNQGLYKKPERTQYGLLVKGSDIPFNQQEQQVTIVPNSLQIQGKIGSPRFYDQIPIVVLFHFIKTHN